MFEFPAELRIPLDRWIDAFVDWLTIVGQPVFRTIGDGLLSLLLRMEWLLLTVPWFVIAALLAYAAWRVAGLQLSLWVIGGLVLIGSLGLWSEAMTTTALVLSASLLAALVGIPLGILMAKSRWIQGVLRPVLDLMQTMPSFVYLIPTLMLFGLGKVPALVATFVYAVPPVIRLTDLGIRQVSREAVEAARAFGSAPWQLLFWIQLPLARPTIMAGLNQTIMMAVAMVVIASMIGAGGLGAEVLQGINQLRVGQGFNGGISIVILAIIIDRLSQGLAGTKRATPLP